MFLWNKKQNNRKSEVEISRWEGEIIHLLWS